MAKATTQIHRIRISEEDQRKNDLREIEDTLLKNKEALLETVGVIQHAHERGLISLVSGLLAEGDKILNILVKKADTPETANTLRNLLLMVGVLGTLNVKQLEPMLLKVNSGIARVAEMKDDDDRIGLFDLFRSLKDPEINRSIALMFEFLKGMGTDTSKMERTTQLPEDQAQHQNEDHTLKV
jgi:uncharacterized protein YjgD (DUF1641 family)